MVKKHWRNFLENKYQVKKKCAGSKMADVFGEKIASENSNLE
jgi:hypothetical protein